MNLRPSLCKSAALPTELIPHRVIYTLLINNTQYVNNEPRLYLLCVEINRNYIVFRRRGKTSRGMVSLANSDPAVIKIMIQNFFSQSWGGLKE